MNEVVEQLDLSGHGEEYEQEAGTSIIGERVLQVRVFFSVIVVSCEDVGGAHPAGHARFAIVVVYFEVFVDHDRHGRLSFSVTTVDVFLPHFKGSVNYSVDFSICGLSFRFDRLCLQQ
ncbi:unnamed protein product [Laminaria digitata]